MDTIVSCLGAHDIGTRTKSKLPHSLFPLAADGLCRVEILVAEDDAEEATFILWEQASHGGGIKDERQDE